MPPYVRSEGLFEDVGKEDPVIDEMQDIWREIERKVLAMAEKDRSRIAHRMTAEEVKHQLTTLRRPIETDTEEMKSGWDTAQTIFSNFITCIEALGRIIAEPASQFFPPYNKCFSAVSYVIQACRGFHGIFASLGELFKGCMQFLGRTEYYKRGGLDLRLKKLISLHLELTVDICFATIKLSASKWKKVTTFTKYLILGDDGIQELFARMKEHSGQEMPEVLAIVFRDVKANQESLLAIQENMDEALEIDKEVAASVSIIATGSLEERKESEASKRKMKIAKALAFDDGQLDKNQLPKPDWHRPYRHMQDEGVTGTGDWLVEHEEFVAWRDGIGDTSPIMVLHGPSGSGKSYLASKVMRHLYDLQAKSPGMAVGIYFLDDDSKATTQHLNSSATMAKVLMWQLAQEPTFQKSVAAICEKKENSLFAKDIWKVLLFHQESYRDVDTKFFVVVDGPANTALPLNDLLLSLGSGGRAVRVFLTGQHSTAEHLTTAGVPFVDFGLTGKNQADVEAYISLGFRGIAAFDISKSPAAGALRDYTLTGLRDRTQSNFGLIKSTFTKIRDLTLRKDIENAVDKSGTPLSEQTQSIIQTLNNIRTVEEINEINEISLWVITGKSWLNLTQMEAVLFMKNGDDPSVPLKEMIQTKYTLFTVDIDDDVVFKNADTTFEEYEDPIITAVHAAENTLVLHMLRNLCPDHIYKRLELDQVFKSATTQNLKAKIRREKDDDAQVKLATTYLRVFTEPSHERTRPIREIAAWGLYSHLSETHIDLVDPKLKAIIGPQIVRFLSQDHAIDAFFWINNEFSAQISTWMPFDNSAAKLFLTWLRDEAVVGGVDDTEDRDWLEGVMTSESPDTMVLKTITVRTAMHWLREPIPEPQVKEACLFVIRFVVINVIPTDSIKNNDTLEEYEPTAQDVYRAEKYAQSELGIEVKDSLWETQVAMALNAFGAKTEVEARYRNALALDPMYWRASWKLATFLENHAQCIAILKPMLERLQNDESWGVGTQNAAYLAEMFFDLGDAFWACHRFDDACHSYNTSVGIDASNVGRDFTILQRYRQRRMWTDMVELLVASCKPAEGPSPNFLVDRPHLVRYFSSNEKFHRFMLKACIETKSFDVLKELYDEAIALAVLAKDRDDLYNLRYYWATALLHQPEKASTATAVLDVALKENYQNTFSFPNEATISQLILLLGPICLEHSLSVPEKKSREEIEQTFTKLGTDLGDGQIESSLLHPSKLFLARYYYRTGTEVLALQTCKSIVSRALETLSDEDPDNDEMAYWRLAFVFLPLNDKANAMTALKMAMFHYHAVLVSNSKEAKDLALSTIDTVNPEDVQVVEVLENIEAEPFDIGIANHEAKSEVLEGVEQPSVPIFFEIAPDSTTHKIDFSDAKVTTCNVKDHNTNMPNQDAADSAETYHSPTTANLIVHEAKFASMDSVVEGLKPTSPNSIISDNMSEVSSEGGIESCDGHWGAATCDGHCGKNCDHASLSFFCQDCINVQFEPRCFHKLKNGTLTHTTCRSSHDFFVLPAWDDGQMSRLFHVLVPYGEDVISLREWKALVREKYVDFGDVAVVEVNREDMGVETGMGGIRS